MPTIAARAARALMRLYPFPRGQGRIIDRSALGRLRFLEQRLVVRTIDGFDIEVLPNDHIGRHLYLTGQFDRTVVEVLLRFARPGDRFLDIGGNVGYVACAFLHRVPDSRVVSVEPQHVVHEVLAANLARVTSVPGRARALKLAVADHAGWGSMTAVPTNTGQSRLQAGAEAPGERVEVVTGPTLMALSGLDRVDVVKIDVERGEEGVVRTLRPVLLTSRARALVFEHFGNLQAPDSELARIFRELDYAVFGIEKHLARYDLVPLERIDAARGLPCDYLALANEEVQRQFDRARGRWRPPPRDVRQAVNGSM